MRPGSTFTEALSVVTAETLGALLVGICIGVLATVAIARYAGPSFAPPEPEPERQSTASEEGIGLAYQRATTDERRVVELLVTNDGRMKQSEIVRETEWSKAKVSRLLSTMEARGEVAKLSVGRENVVSLGTAVVPAE
ncbi:helix-turn-helix transcriptional regulator [Natronorarus salvus]|uniref:helix-turn-helix transcriptional regulator n=1 Tax=Natronorarus salvus TaxID=3117733 RepID=UPI002F2686AE